jgi:hypothetical protein
VATDALLVGTPVQLTSAPPLLPGLLGQDAPVEADELARAGASDRPLFAVIVTNAGSSLVVHVGGLARVRLGSRRATPIATSIGGRRPRRTHADGDGGTAVLGWWMEDGTDEDLRLDGSTSPACPQERLGAGACLTLVGSRIRVAIVSPALNLRPAAMDRQLGHARFW